MRHNSLNVKSEIRRSGAVLVCVLACMLIAISMAASGVHLAMLGARASKQNLRSRQTQWLLQAGVARAHHGLQRGDYMGEEWLVPASQLPESSGRVVITVAPVESAPVESATDPLYWQVTVTAEYGSSASQLTRRSHSFKSTIQQTAEGAAT
ncbi:MAG: hypothetical protein ABI557_10830 [Aureliella sp.]